MLNNQYSIAKVREIIGAEGDIVRNDFINILLTDSRRITTPAGGLFFALSGRRNGHEFIAEAYAAGVRNFVVRQEPGIRLPDANFLIVADVLRGLQTLAKYHRERFNLDVIGVTGSNGKTIVKEWLYQLLSANKNIVRNPKSYNSQIGVPLSIWQITERNDLGIFEAGISQPGEMDRLEAIIKPGIGVLTHLGTAHDEGFNDTAEKIKEKLKLFKNCRLLVYNYDQMVDYKDAIGSQKCFTWSRNFKQADLHVFSETISKKHYYLRANYKGQEIACMIPFLDQASVENAIVCWATLLALGYSATEAGRRLEHLHPVSMRLELKTGINDCSVIDDTYNSDIHSLEIALNFLNQQNQHKKKTLVLSDIYQSGLPDDVLYRQVADLIKSKKVDKFIGVGQAIKLHQQYFDVPQKFFFADTTELLDNLPVPGFKSETILIKGSRSFEFERVSRALVQKTHETVMEINLNAMLGNLNYYRSKLKPGVKLMAMVKAFSYGSGTFELANMLQYNNVDYLAVAYTDEGISLRQAGISMPIVVLNAEQSAFEKLAEYNLEPVLYSFGIFTDFTRFAQQNQLTDYPVHLKIDSGMHRLGFECADIDLLCELLTENKLLQIMTMFSHLAASEAPAHDEFTQLQIDRFTDATAKIERCLGYKTIKHLCNTSGISRWPSAQFDMVRLGIGLYGIDAAVPATDEALQPITSLKTSISQVKKIAAGETVGYGRKGVMLNGGQIATVRIGYADGYLRAFGNGVGNMLVNGVVVPTIGNISMDMCMIDVSGVEVNEGDEVIVFNHQHRIEELAAQIGTIPYEILTNISQRVKRVYFYE
jgi:alanine racemase